MREGSAVWGGATLGLVVGLILGFFVGSYWTTVLYAVLIGAAVGVASVVVAWGANRLSGSSPRTALTMSPENLARMLQGTEDALRQYSPAEFESNRDAATECVTVVHYVEEEDLWQAGYDSLESFYAAHEARHPDIRAYGAVYREVLLLDLPEDADPRISERIAQLGEASRQRDSP